MSRASAIAAVCRANSEAERNRFANVVRMETIAEVFKLAKQIKKAN